MPDEARETQSPPEDLQIRTEALIKWMGLENVPDAKTFDPDNKIGLQGAYVLADGSYRDPILQSVVTNLQEELAREKEELEHQGNPNGWIPPTSISLLKDQYLPIPTTETIGNVVTIGSRRIPLFAEQVRSVAQYLIKLGIESPTQLAGKDFVISEPRTAWAKTQNPNLHVSFVRDEEHTPSSKVTEIDLVVSPKRN